MTDHLPLFRRLNEVAASRWITWGQPAYRCGVTFIRLSRPRDRNYGQLDAAPRETEGAGCGILHIGKESLW